MSSADEPLLVDRLDNGVLVLTLNRPAALNATDRALGARLDDALSEAESDPSIRALVLTGTGRAFSAGNDLKELQGMTRAEVREVTAQRAEWTWHWTTSTVPTVAALNGLAFGNGAILAMGSDLRVGEPETTMRVTATASGIANDTWILPSLIGMSHAKDLLLTGRTVPADELFHMGLLNRLAPRGHALSEAVALAQSIAANPVSGPRDVKELLTASSGLDLKTRFERECDLQDRRVAAGEALLASAPKVPSARHPSKRQPNL